MKSAIISIGSAALAFVLCMSYVATTPNRLIARRGMTDAMRAFNWWYDQRAYPHDLIPQASFQKAVRYVSSSMKKENVFSPSGTTSGGWTSLGPVNIGGRALALAVDPSNPDIVWAGAASGGLWKTTNGGVGLNAWSYVNTGFNTLSVSAISLDPGNSHIIYIGTGEISLYHRPLIGVVGARASYGMGVLKSTDGGTTWAQTGLTFTFPQITAIQKLAINPLNTRTIYAATSEGVYKSTDAGASWAVSDTVLMAMDVAINPVDTTIVYAAHGNLNSSPNPGIYMTTDAGASWLQRTVGLPSSNFGRTALALSPSSPSIIYAGISDASTSGIIGLYKSTNQGITWTQVSTVDYVGSQGWYNNVVAVHPTGADTVFCSGFDIYKSTNGGTTLNNVSSGVVHVDHHAIAFAPSNPDIMYFGCDGGVYKTTDGGSTFININNSFVTTQFYPGFANALADSTIAMGGLQDNGSLMYTGTPFWQSVLGADGGWCAIDPTNAAVMYGEFQNLALFKTTNSWSTASQINNGLPASSSNTNFIPPFVISFSSPNVLYAGLKDVYKTTDGGSTWNPTNGGVDLNGTPLACIGVSWSSPDTLLAATGTGALGATPLFRVYASTNGGGSWTNVTDTLPDRYPTDIEFDPAGGTTAYITYSGYGSPHVFRTTDLGQNWTNVTSNLPDIPHQAVTVDPLDSRQLYVGTDLGVYHSSDAGASWEDFNTGMLPAMVLDLAVSRSNGALRAATFGNGIYQRPLVRIPSVTLLAPVGGEMLSAGSTFTVRWSEKFVGLVALDFSTDNGASWTLIADSLAAGSGAYGWAIPLVSSSTARLRIRQSGGTAVDSSHAPFTILLNPDVALGWNLLSIDRKVADPRKTTLFPSAVSNAFAYNGSYVIADSLRDGQGYWLKFGQPQFTSYSGDSILTDTAIVHTGWNLIGSLSKSVATGSIVDSPAGITASQYFGYINGYQVTDTIHPKKGYWIKVSADGKLILRSASQPPAIVSVRSAIDDPDTVTITDAASHCASLYLETHTASGESRWDMPPLPPAGGFDVRFGSQRMLEMVRGDRSSGFDLPILINGGSGSMTIRWSVSPSSPSYLLRAGGGKDIALTGTGSASIGGAIHVLSLHVGPKAGGVIPAGFSLEPNYPNPFNPQTSIGIRVARDGVVSLKIYDVRGAQVAVLAEGPMKAGVYHLTWNAGQVASGIYFCRMTAEGFSASDKLLLIR